MPIRPLLAAAVLVLPLPAMAESPNIVPGQWRFTHTTTVEGDAPIPDQTETYEECIGQGDLDDAEFQFLEVEDECELLEHNVSAEGLDYSMICYAEGGEANIEGRMEFLEERVEGSVDIRTESQLGAMEMHTEVEGERIGEC